MEMEGNENEGGGGLEMKLVNPLQPAGFLRNPRNPCIWPTSAN